MAAQLSTTQLIEQKLAAFDQLQPEFERCFLFVEDMHGRKRFATGSISDIVRYLHALWICDCRTYLLSVARTVKTYNGVRCLDLLQQWQEQGSCAPIVEFLYDKLDALSIGSITRQIEVARRDPAQREQIQRLLHGRAILLNRGMNLLHLLDALFVWPEDALLHSVREACRYYGHTPEQIVQQRELFAAPLYAYCPQQSLSQRNMQVMNKLGVQMQLYGIEKSKSHPARVAAGPNLVPPYAEEIIPNYQEFSSMM
jgi:hypothetical protein